MSIEPLVALLPAFVMAAGIGQIALVIASPLIPRLLGWREDTAKLRPLTRQIFWTWASYIWLSHLSFGLLSALAPGWLLDGSPLAAAVTGFIALWWGARLVIQFACIDREGAGSGLGVRLGEAALVTLFVGLTAVYACATVANLVTPGGALST
ncbi:MAG: hypothetical protein WD278_16565 [Pirellulales bacterium]